VLERFVAHLRSCVETRFWHLLGQGVTDAQKASLDDLLVVPTGRRALFRSVSQRSAEKRETPWKTLMRELYKALLTLGDNSVRAAQNEFQAEVSVDSC
jgi:hypothetical protein